MVSWFKGNAKKQKVAGENRYFDRTYYMRTNAPRWSSRNYDSFALEGYINNVVAHRAIGMIARGVASIGLTFFEIDGIKNGKTVKRELLDDDAVVMLVQNPNPTMSYTKFIESIVCSYLISGNAYIQAVRDADGRIVEMYNLRSDRVSVVPGSGGIPSGYRYSINNAVYEFPCNTISGDCDVLQIKTFHPLDDWYGLSPLESAQYSIEQHNECIKWNKSLLENGARPCGALVVKNEMNDETFKRMKQSLDEKIRGEENAGKIMILEGGIEWKEMSISPRDMDFIETKNMAARDIASAFGVPSQLLGIAGDTTYNNMAEARKTFWEDTILPIAKTILNELSSWISNADGRKIVIEPDLDTIPALYEERQKTWEAVQNSDFVSDEEKRESLGFEKEKSAENNSNDNKEN